MKTKMKPISKLTKAQKRVLIAKDVLKQIAAETYLLQKGNYVSAVRGSNSWNQSRVLKNKTRCKVCACGAAVLSSLRLFNKFTVRNMDASDGGVNGVLTVLGDVFEYGQIALIEAAFEGCNSCISDTIKDDSYEWEEKMNTANGFCRSTAAAPEKAKAIFKNIITNKGTFKP